MATKLNASLKNYHPRMIIKLYDYIVLPDEPESEIGSYLEKEKILPWKKISLKYPKARISRLFTTLTPKAISEMVKKAEEMDKDYKPVNLNNYLAINYPVGTEKDKLLEEVKKIKSVENAYIEGIPARPQAVSTTRNPRSPDQHHLDPSPTGIDARYASGIAGGDGTGTIKFIDIEQGWILSHEDLPDQTSPAEVKLLSGENTQPRGHGTSVLGIVLAQDNTRGGIGIVPFVKGDVISSIRSDIVINDNPDYNVADAILVAVSLLARGDVLLIEEVSIIRNRERPCEADPHLFDTIRIGTSLGIVIIEPAGNGNFDLDRFQDSGKFIFKKPTTNNPNPDFKDSGAIMVGASTSEVPHLRHDVSNFGSRIDCFAWGEHINTAGSGRTSYTGRFGGTSGASAIVAGAAISVQSMYEAKNLGRRLRPREMRKILSDDNNGTNSAEPVVDKIGVMPDLQKIASLI